MKLQIVGIFAYCLASQTLNMMAFMQLYPALKCSNGKGVMVDCTQEEACALDQNETAIDWDQRISLHNWMTELNLICVNPATIGIMGTITFVSIGLGSILLGGLIDRVGRRKVLLGTLIVSPVVHSMWLIYPSLTTIYIGLFLMGLVYAVRGSCAYVYTTEGLLSAA